MENQEKFNRFGKATKGAGLISETNNAVIYTRVSTKEQAETNMSLSTQKKYCVEYVVNEFGGTYESAASDERKEFKRMLNFIQKSKQKISHIIVYSLDRFSRTGEGAISIAKDLRDEGVNVVSVMQPADTKTPTGKLQ